jgi:hypothetical protein
MGSAGDALATPHSRTPTHLPRPSSPSHHAPANRNTAPPCFSKATEPVRQAKLELSTAWAWHGPRPSSRPTPVEKTPHPSLHPSTPHCRSPPTSTSSRPSGARVRLPLHVSRDQPGLLLSRYLLPSAQRPDAARPRERRPARALKQMGGLDPCANTRRVPYTHCPWPQRGASRNAPTVDGLVPCRGLYSHRRNRSGAAAESVGQLKLLLADSCPLQIEGGA